MVEDNLLDRLYKWAVFNRQGENFITEAFAHLLRHLRDSEPDVAVRILDKLTVGHLRITVEQVRGVQITAQVSTEPGKRPDLELRTQNTLVYVEAKVESPPDLSQLLNYRTELERCGSPNTGLILLTRYPAGIPLDSSLRHACRRWYEVADWLVADLEQQAIRGVIGVHLTDQFVGLLEARGMTMDKVGKELPGGVRACLNLMKMLREAIAGLRLQQSDYPAKESTGCYLDNKKAWIGVSYKKPDVIRFHSNELPVTVSGRLKMDHLWALQKQPGDDG